MVLLGSPLDVCNTLFDSSHDLSDFEGFPPPSGRDWGLILGMQMNMILFFHQAEGKKTDLPKIYERSKWSFDTTLTDIFTATPGFSIEIPDDTIK